MIELPNGNIAFSSDGYNASPIVIIDGSTYIIYYEIYFPYILIDITEKEC